MGKPSTRLLAPAVALAVLAAVIVLSGVWGRVKEHVEGPARELVANYGLPGVFLVMILAGSFLPMASPAIVALCASLGAPPVPLVLVSALGYTVGLMANYAFGRFLGLRFVEKHVKKEQFERLSAWLNRWGLGLVAIFAVLPATPLETLSMICGTFGTHPAKLTLVSFTFKAVQFAIFAFIGLELAQLIWD